MTSPTLHLTWAGLDAAVDVIAAQAPRNCSAVCGMDRAGEVLAWALSERLGIECAARPCSDALLVWGLVERKPRTRCADAAIWAWVDMTPGSEVQSVMKVTSGTAVLMPWQDASARRREFVAGFDD